MANHSELVSQLRRITLTVRSVSNIALPTFDGYSVYSALLGVLADIDEEVSAHVLVT